MLTLARNLLSFATALQAPGNARTTAHPARDLAQIARVGATMTSVKAADAASAVSAAWSAYRADFKRPVKLMTSSSARDGWDERKPLTTKHRQTSAPLRAYVHAVGSELKKGTVTFYAGGFGRLKELRLTAMKTANCWSIDLSLKSRPVSVRFDPFRHKTIFFSCFRHHASFHARRGQCSRLMFSLVDVRVMFTTPR